MLPAGRLFKGLFSTSKSESRRRWGEMIHQVIAGCSYVVSATAAISQHQQPRLAVQVVLQPP